MATFSTLVDSIVADLMRPERRQSVIENLNVTIRELHVMNSSRGGAPIRFSENLKEVVFTPAANPVYWPIPVPGRFMGLETIWDMTRGFAYQERTPRTVGLLEQDVVAQGIYYRVGNTIAFDGAYIGGQIAIGYYEFLPSLRYLLPAQRIVAELDPNVYTRVGGGAALTQAELAKETNWMLDRHDTALRLGTLAKVFTAINDLDRSRMVYSSYETLRSSLILQESNA